MQILGVASVCLTMMKFDIFYKITNLTEIKIIQKMLSLAHYLLGCHW